MSDEPQGEVRSPEEELAEAKRRLAEEVTRNEQLSEQLELAKEGSRHLHHLVVRTWNELLRLYRKTGMRDAEISRQPLMEDLHIWVKPTGSGEAS